MAFEPGGIADKLGNRYEGRWVVRQMLRVLNEEIRSVGVELIGDDERGVDLWIDTNEGVRRTQQCKARSRASSGWSISELNRCQVLTNMRYQLERNPSYEFELVSAAPAIGIGDLCESARAPRSDPEGFYRHQIVSVGKTRAGEYEKFCRAVGLNAGKPADRAIAFDLLRRMYFYLHNDDRHSLEELWSIASVLVAGPPETVVSVLRDYAEQKLRRPLYADEIRAHLARLGFHPKDLAHDRRIAPAIEGLQQEFSESIQPSLIDGDLLARKETGEILSAIEQGARVIVLHGRAGYGKTGVIFELTAKLAEWGIPFLPVRLDRRSPANTPHHFGESMGLPDSPTQCVAAIAGHRPSVLILDQLDALRWTVSHTSHALDVCKAIIREAHGLGAVGKPVAVVLACRSFDLENDPELHNWLGKETRDPIVKVEVKPLAAETVRLVLERHGEDYAHLPDRRKEILGAPQNLALWVEVRNDGDLPEFRSATELMRKFWLSRRGKLRHQGFSGAEVSSALDLLVDRMQMRVPPTAPERVLDDQPRIREALHSLNIIHTARRQIAFCHQSFMDFLVAERILRQIDAGTGSVVTWLGGKESQSLFRREQLRHVLSLLADESPDHFLATITELLHGEVRFHLKHLALEIVSQLEQPTEPLLDFVFRLFDDSYWAPHVLDTVCFRRRPFVQALVDRGLIRLWLDLSDASRANWALWLLRSMNERLGDIVAEQLEPFLAKGGDWPARVQYVLPIGAIGDSERLFELRLRLARDGHADELVDWTQLAKGYPHRAIALVEAVLSTWEAPDKGGTRRPARPRNGRSRLENWYGADLSAMHEAARHLPEQTWDLLMPHVERLTSFVPKRYDPRLDDWEEDFIGRQRNLSTTIARGTVEMLCEAGRVLAAANPDALLSRTVPLHPSVSLVVQRILVHVYAALPPDYADHGLQWLNTPDRFALGPGTNEPPWSPAAWLIESLSPHCSDHMFRELEQAITYYHSPEERQHAEYLISGWRKGLFGDWFGRAQHILLPALAPMRRSPATDGMIGVLRRKFQDYPEDEFLQHRFGVGGSIRSPLRSEVLHRISDKAWLGIITSERVACGRRVARWRQIDEDSASEASVEQFSRDLRNLAHRFPQRFASLALRFPVDTHPEYVAAIIDGMAATKPGEVPEEERAAWTPAEHTTVESVLARFPMGNSRSAAMEFCRLLRVRAEEDWSDVVIAKLVDFAANHPDPRPGQLAVGSQKGGLACDTADVKCLETNSPNCVRSAAGLAVAALLWDHPDWFEKLRPAVETLVRDPHPVVRIAGVDACTAVFNIAREFAIDRFCEACRDDFRVAACERATQLFNAAIVSHYARLAPLVVAMLRSDRPDVSEQGAKEVTARWLFHGLFANELLKCQTGAPSQRKGVADIAARFLGEEAYREKCGQLLLSLFDDADEEVRREAGMAFGYRGFRLSSLTPNLTESFVRSRAFRDDPTWLLRALEDHEGSLLPLTSTVFAICEAFSGPLAELSRDMATGLAHDMTYLPKILLRLYEQAQDPPRSDIQARCLDMWDALFEQRVGMMRELTKAIET